jgi:murein DD-endopeptidase MepM/ murein hydrolase activator NlpD
MASPEYPIRPGEAAGDGALHMTEHPEYPIDPTAAAAPKPPAAPAQPTPPPPPADDDTPHAVPHSEVESTDLPPPSAATPAPQTAPAPPTTSQAEGGRFERAVSLDRLSLLERTLRSDAIWDDGRPASGPAAGFEQVVLHRRHRHAAANEDGAKNERAKGKAKSARQDKHGKHGRHSETAQVASRSGRYRVRLHSPIEASADVPAAEIETPYETKVKPGERAGDVAARLHVSKQVLMSLNDIKTTRKLHPGEVLKVPYRLVYTVGQGDTLFAISHRFGQDMDAVAKLNGLKHAAALHLGETIALPLTAEDAGPREHAKGHGAQPEAAPPKLIEAELAKARAEAHRKAREEAARLAVVPHEARSEPTSMATAAAPSSQIAAPQTTPAQADAPDVDNGVRMAAELNERELASRTPSPKAPGYSVSNEMAAERPAATPWSTPPSPGASSTQANSAPARVANLNAPTYYPPGYNAPVLGRVRPTAPTGETGPVTDADVSTAGRGLFIWPLKGAILSPFGDRGPGQRNDGLDISASTGESVKAAAGGEVVYAGSSIPGFGNLVLVKHPGGWVTAYAHLDRIEVRMRDEVTQGEEIGQAGETGVVDRPELHFEIRYAPDPSAKARPVDPTLVLPEAVKGSG